VIDAGINNFTLSGDLCSWIIFRRKFVRSSAFRRFGVPPSGGLEFRLQAVWSSAFRRSVSIIRINGLKAELQTFGVPPSGGLEFRLQAVWSSAFRRQYR